jgi:transposase
MNTMEKLQMANIRISQLEEELAALQKSSPDTIVSQLKAFYTEQHKEDLAVRERQKEFFEKQTTEIKAEHARQLKAQEEKHRLELAGQEKKYRIEKAEQDAKYERLLKAIENKDKSSRKEDDDDHDDLMKLRGQVTYLQARLEKAGEDLKSLKALKKFEHSRRFVRSAEQQRLLNNRNEITRAEEKAGYDGESVTGDAEGRTVDVRPAYHRTQEHHEPRIDYAKNKPYTANPRYHYLSDYFTLPDGGRYVQRRGHADTWWYHVVHRIPEHYEEDFYEAAKVIMPGPDGGSVTCNTMENPCYLGVSRFDTEMLSFILTQKFCYNNSLNEVAGMLSHKGCTVSVKTIGSVVNKVIEKIRRAMSEMWKSTTFNTENLMIDETTGMVGIDNEETGKREYKNRYFWGFKANLKKMVWFVYEHGSRAAKVLRPILDEFIGFFTSDGYIVYKIYDKDDHPNQRRSACLTHIRRNFIDSLIENHEGSMWFIEEFGKLFGVEYECRKLNLSPEDRLYYRKKHSGSIMDRIKKKLEEYLSSGYAGCGELFTKALKYARREWSAMEMVLENGGLELSNNLAEQMMRHFKRTLKNCLNIGSERSAKNVAFMFSVVESCAMNAISPVVYIKDLLVKFADENISNQTLLPCYYAKVC